MKPSSNGVISKSMIKRSPLKITLILVSLFLSYATLAFEVTDDVMGSADYTGFDRYPGSKIDQYSRDQAIDYLLVLGKLKKIDNKLEPEYAQRLQGQLTRITYHIPEGNSAKQAYQFYAEQLSSAELLFECSARDCGSSSYWANQIFNISTLYGPDNYQHYSVYRKRLNEKELLIVLYSIMRGNKRVYAHLDFLETRINRTQDLSINPDTLLNSLRRNKYLALSELEFNEKDELVSESLSALATLVKALNKSIRLKFYLVGHLNQEANDTIDKLLARSLKRATEVKLALVKMGIESTRLEAHGVGPLAPAVKEDKASNGRIELVLKAD